MYEMWPRLRCGQMRNFEDSSSYINGDRAKLRFMLFSTAAVERMRIREIENLSEHPRTWANLIIFEPWSYDLPFSHKASKKKKNKKNNKN